MARHIIGSQNITDTVSAIQFIGSVKKPGVLAGVFTARATNTGNVFLGSDSVAKSSGHMLLPGDVHRVTYTPFEMDASTFWVFGQSSGDKLDWEVVRAN